MPTIEEHIQKLLVEQTMQGLLFLGIIDGYSVHREGHQLVINFVRGFNQHTFPVGVPPGKECPMCHRSYAEGCSDGSCEA